jgi:hypothetical protein
MLFLFVSISYQAPEIPLQGKLCASVIIHMTIWLLEAKCLSSRPAKPVYESWPVSDVSTLTQWILQVLASYQSKGSIYLWTLPLFQMLEHAYVPAHQLEDMWQQLQNWEYSLVFLSALCAHVSYNYMTRVFVTSGKSNLLPSFC